MDSGVWARTLISKFVDIDDEGRKTLIEDPFLDDLPQWILEACWEGKIFMTPNDNFTHLWVETPYMVESGHEIYVVATPGCIMIPRDGEVIVLSKPTRAFWDRVFS